MKIQSKTSFNNINLIIFEEYFFMREMLVDIFKAFGVENICSVDNVLDIKKHLQSNLSDDPKDHVDLLVIDLVPPNNHGVHVLEWMRSQENPALRYLPVIFTTSDSRTQSIKQIRDIGSSEILLKPYTAEKVSKFFLHAINKPRAFVDSSKYVGPDRRRKKQLNHGEENRRSLSRDELEIIYEDAIS